MCIFIVQIKYSPLVIFGFLSIFLCTIGNILSPNWFLQGIGDFKKLSYSQVIVRITLFIILLVYVCSGGDNVFILSFCKMQHYSYAVYTYGQIFILAMLFILNLMNALWNLRRQEMFLLA